MVSLFVNPASSTIRPTSPPTHATGARPRVAAASGVDLLFAPASTTVPARARDLGRRRRSGRAPNATPSRPLPRRRDCLREAVQHRPPETSRTSGRRMRSRSPSIRRLVRDLNVSLAIRVVPDRARRRRPRALVAQRPPVGRRAERALALPRALSRPSTRPIPSPPPAPRSTASTPDYVELRRPRRRKLLAAAVRVGATRLIDNVLLEGGRSSRDQTTRSPSATPLPGLALRQQLPLRERLAEMKRRGDKIVMVTAYDAPSGRLADAAGVDLILVGDSSGMVVPRPRGRRCLCPRRRDRVS